MGDNLENGAVGFVGSRQRVINLSRGVARQEFRGGNKLKTKTNEISQSNTSISKFKKKNDYKLMLKSGS